MQKSLLIVGLAAALAAPSLANADCHGRKIAGTVLGGVTGGVIGGAVSHGAAPAVLLGAGLGAFTGHEVAGGGCHSYRRAYYYRHYYRRARYDRYASAGPAYDPAPTPQCQTISQPYYDQNGAVSYRPAQVCR